MLILCTKEGSDPAAVVYDAVSAFKSRNADVLICDTAGRLHNKRILWRSLKKINRVIERECRAYRETLVVLDGVLVKTLWLKLRINEVADITGIGITN